jgi:hypothetical protein
VVLENEQKNADFSGREGFRYLLINDEVQSFPVQL